MNSEEFERQVFNQEHIPLVIMQPGKKKTDSESTEINERRLEDYPREVLEAVLQILQKRGLSKG